MCIFLFHDLIINLFETKVKYFVKTTKLLGEAKTQLTVCFISKVIRSYRVVDNGRFHWCQPCSREDILHCFRENIRDNTAELIFFPALQNAYQLLFFKIYLVVSDRKLRYLITLSFHHSHRGRRL